MLAIVTERQVDTDIIRAFLPDGIWDYVRFSEGRGASDGTARASTILLVRREIMVYVTNTEDMTSDEIKERRAFLQRFLGRDAMGLPHKVVVAVPELPIILVEDKRIFDEILGRESSATEWTAAQQRPAAALSPEGDIKQFNMAAILQRLSSTSLAQIKRHPYIAEVRDFINENLETVQG